MLNKYKQDEATKLLRERDMLSPQTFVSKTRELARDSLKNKVGLYPEVEFVPSQTVTAVNILLAILNHSGQLPKRVKESKVKEPQEIETPSSLAVRGNDLDTIDPDKVIIPNYYEVLGVDKDATPEEIKKAHRKLVKEFHPDTLGPDATIEDRAQANAVIQEINVAYSIVGGKGNRKDYDKIKESEVAQIEESFNYGTAGSIMVFYEPSDTPGSPNSPKPRRRSLIPAGFFDQSRIMRLQNGSVEKNLAIAMMLSKNKVSNERMEGIVSLLIRWGKMNGKSVIPDKINEQLSYVNQNLGLLNNQQQKDKGENPGSQISSIAFIQSDGTVIVADPNTTEDKQITHYQSINVVPQFIQKQTSTTIDINQQMELSLNNSNFSFRDNPVFKLLQDKAGGLLKKQALKELEKAGIKFVGKQAAKFAAATGLKLAVRAGLHALAETLNVIPGLGLIASALLEIGMRIIGKVVGLIKKYSREIAMFGVGMAMLGIAGGSALFVALGSLAAVPHIVAVGPGAAIGGAVSTATGAMTALFASMVLAVSSVAVVGGIGLVIFVSLVLFIINNSAFVTPQGNTLTGGYSGGGSIPGDPVDTNCPVIDYEYSTVSYVPGEENSTPDGHGSNKYWLGQRNTGPEDDCRWSLPVNTGCFGPRDPLATTNVCRNEPSLCSFYGYAVDLVSSNNNVYLPNITDSWNFVDSYPSASGATGWGHVYESGIYTIVLLHLNQTVIEGDNIPSGTNIGVLFDQGDNTHLHLELMVDGAYVRPEEHLCP